MEKLLLNIAVKKNCTVKLFQPHCSVHLDRASTGLENLFAYLFTVSFMHVTCADQT
jgi:hypothetical protein